MKFPWQDSDAPDPSAAPVGIDANRWAQRADQLQYTQLDGVRSTAQNWRTGLAGLTSLLSVTSIVVAPNLADKLAGNWRIGAIALVLAGLLALLYGTWKAMVAAYGVPGEATLITGTRLWSWEFEQAASGARALRRARQATLAGLGFIIGATAVVLIGTSAGSAAGPLVRVDTKQGSFCGHLGDTVKPELDIVGNDGTVHAIAGADLQAVKSVTSC